MINLQKRKRELSITFEKIGTSSNVIVILPGWGETKKTFAYMIDHLKRNYTVYIVDYPGFGKNPPLTEEREIEDYAEGVKHFLKQENIKKPVVIAHSFGGRIVSILASEEKEIFEKILLIDVAGIKRRKIIPYLKQMLYKMLKRVAKIMKRKDWEQKLLRAFASPDYQAIPITMRKTFQNIIQKDLKKHYQQITTETLIIWGEKDQDTPLKDAYLLKKIIKNSGLIIYKKASHFSYLENPILTNSILDHFLKKEE